MSASIELISEMSQVAAALPVDVVSELTYPSIFRECPGLVFPARLEITESDGSRRAVHILNHPDSDPFAKKLPDEPAVAYGRYFEWNASGGPGGSFAEAVRAAAGTGEIVVGADLVLTRYEALAATGPLRLKAPRRAVPVQIYAKSRSEIEAQWDATRRADNRRLEGFVAGLRCGAELQDWLARPAVGFAALDAGLEAAGLAGLLVTSAHNVELFTGLSYEAITSHGVSCLYLAGKAQITVFAETPLLRSDFVPRGAGADLPEALALALKPTDGLLGIEEPSIGIGLVEALKGAGLTVKPAIATLRKWQEALALPDLGYFILAANAVIKGFEHAKGWFARLSGPEAAPQERDLEALFQQGVADFAAANGFAGRVKPYFSIIHSGGRTLLPASAGDYPARFDDPTIKFDMGVLVYDAFGCVRACSDIARTICTTPALQAAHDALRAALVDLLIPAMRPGMTGGEVHGEGVKALRACETQLKAAGLMPEGVTFEGYTRDCGHILHRTTTATIFFLPGVSAPLAPGMLGCVEYVWPLGDLVLAVEDGYLVTESGAIPFTE